ncbi:MAG: hypothetical protein PHQ47_03450 [Candidatus Portnoybacteria bacterium]|nr:hypothetical protein [Candidatus Portnoybacteria bacterium]
MDNPWLQKKIFIGIGAVCLNLTILAAGGWFLTAQIIKDNQKLADKKDKIEEINLGWEKYREESRVKQIDSSLKTFQSSFFSKENPLDFISEIEFYAQATDNLFDIDFFSAGEKSDKKEKDNFLSFRVSLIGSFPDFMHFLRCLENMKYYVQVQQIQISKSEENASQIGSEAKIEAGDVRSSINLKAFISPK